MKLYLSSYGIGNQEEKLKQLFARNKRIAYIPNALDFSGANSLRIRQHRESDVSSLRELGFEVTLLDLKIYFGKQNELRTIIGGLGGLWISGGNVFVLRQAMKLSGLDDILHELTKREDFVYGGYSAAGCVLSERLEAYQIVDDAKDLPYPQVKEQIWEGIGLIDFVFLPHFDSHHPESSDIARELLYCEEHHLSYKTLRDGEVLIF